MRFLAKVFPKKPTEEDQLRAATVQQQTITVAVKAPVYHEIVPHDGGAYVVRIYGRRSGLLEECYADSKAAAQSVALGLIAKHSGG